MDRQDIPCKSSDAVLNVAAFLVDWLSLDPSHKLGGKRHYEADTQLTVMLYDTPFIGWLLIALIAASTSDPQLLAHLGAGPLETLLRSDPITFIPIAVSESRSSTSIRLALRSVWLCCHSAPPDLLDLLETTIPGFQALEDCGCKADITDLSSPGWP